MWKLELKLKHILAHLKDKKRMLFFFILEIEIMNDGEILANYCLLLLLEME